LINNIDIRQPSGQLCDWLWAGRWGFDARQDRDFSLRLHVQAKQWQSIFRERIPSFPLEIGEMMEYIMMLIERHGVTVIRFTFGI
jgi:hypothetical protein